MGELIDRQEDRLKGKQIYRKIDLQIDELLDRHGDS